MIPDTTSHAKDMSNNVVDISHATAKIAAEVIRKLMEVLRSKNLLKEPNKPKLVEVKLGKEVMFRGVEGQEPEVNKLSSEQAKLLQSALNLPESQTAQKEAAIEESKGAISIKVDGQPFYQRSQGVVKINQFQTAPEQEINRTVVAVQGGVNPQLVESGQKGREAQAVPVTPSSAASQPQFVASTTQAQAVAVAPNLDRSVQPVASITQVQESANQVQPESLAGEERQRAYLTRGTEREKTGDFQGALKDYSTAIESADDPVWTMQSHIQRASLHAQLGNHREAVADYTSAIAISPSHDYAYHFRAQSYSAMGNERQASQDLQKHSDIQAAQYLGFSAFRAEERGDKQAALKDLNEAVRLNPQSSGLLATRARVHEALGNNAAAQKDMAKADQLDQRSLKAASPSRGVESVPVFVIIKDHIASSVKEGTIKKWMSQAVSGISTALSNTGNALKTGLEKLNATIVTDRGVKDDFKEQQAAGQIEKTARRLLDTYRGSGSERSFEMKKTGYTVTQTGNTLKINDRNGREVINSSPGALKANINSRDQQVFKAASRELDKTVSRQQAAL
jgi:tetratricopeptide (TPR) repeat protein